jgi:ATP-dependent DNA ligase
LNERNPMFVVPTTARTREEKMALAQRQLNEGREGEVWTRANSTYHAGKDKSEDVVRTKYLVEFDARIIGLTPTTAQGRLFGAIEIADVITGKPLGNVGTGFDRATQQNILVRHNANPGKVVIPVVSQGYTETGKSFHCRLSEEFKKNQKAIPTFRFFDRGSYL